MGNRFSQSSRTTVGESATLGATIGVSETWQRKYIGPQVQTRKSFGNGIYIFRGNPGSRDAAAITGFFMHPLVPDKNFYPNEAELARWTEYDWEFVPQNTAPQMQHSVSIGAFPKQTTTDYRSEGFGQPKEIKGEYEDDIYAQQVAVAKKTDQVKTWQRLVENTGNGKIWTYAQSSDPSTMWAPPSALKLPDRTILEHSVAISSWRTPYGTKVIPSKIGQNARYIPVQAAHVNGYTHKITEFAWAQISPSTPTTFAYDPFDGAHDYTIVLTDTSVTFYIDAPNGGSDINSAHPVRHYSTQDYPSLTGVINNGYPGGDAIWNYYGLPKKVGNLLMIMNVWNDESDWSGPSNKPNTAYVERVRCIPANGAPGDNMDVDFTKLTKDNWGYVFQKNFVVQTNNSLIFSADNIAWKPSPVQGKPALALSMLDSKSMPPPSKYTYFTLIAGGDQKDKRTWMEAEIDVSDSKGRGLAYALTTFTDSPKAVFWPHGMDSQDPAKKQSTSGVINVWRISEPTRTETAKITFLPGPELNWKIDGGATVPWLPATPTPGLISVGQI